MPPPLLLLLLSFLSAASADLSSDRTALLALRAALGGRTFFWNTTVLTPCNWQGVQCENNRVTALRLPAASLVGALPSNTLSNLTLLRTLSLRLNHLSGPLPGDLSQLSQLRSLYLQGNQFSGVIPDSLFNLNSLVRLDLASNNFSGRISTGFNNLTRLRTLYLENNQFIGSLPNIELPHLVQFNVSFNSLLNGSVPVGLQGKPNSAFLGTLLCGKPLDKTCAIDNLTPAASPVGGNNANSGDGERKKSLSSGAIAGIVIGSVVGLFLLLLVLIILCRKRSGSKSRSVGVEAVKSRDNEGGETPMVEAGNGGISSTNGFTNEKSEIGGGANVGAADAKKLVFFSNMTRVFDLEELLRASAEVLGKGTYGTTYKAVLEVGAAVAVKRLRDVTVSEREFKEKVAGIGNMDHENLVPLRAYYYSREEKLLVYDYMTMGSLSALLHGNKGTGHTPLKWEFRSSIALGAARAIEYLHRQGQHAVHGNIKSSNILLTKSHEARISDFGLYYLIGPPSTPTRASGYRAPEVFDPRNISQKADVYSFGILLLELLTGKAPTHTLMNEEGVDLPRWVQSVVKDEWTSEVFDCELVQEQGGEEEEMVQVLQLGIDCTAQHPDNRPLISDVVKRILEICRLRLRDNQEQPDHVSETD